MSQSSAAELERWLTVPREHEHLEFKEAKNQYDSTKLFRYCVALANEGGGKLVLGVTDKPPRAVVGSRAFPDVAEVQSRILERLRFRVDVEEIQHPEGRVVVFHVPSRPAGTAYHLDGAFLMRSGEDTIPMSEDRLRAIFEEGKLDWLSRPAREGCTGDSIVDLLDTQSYFELMKLPYPSERDAVLDRLEREQIVVASAVGWTISTLGALLFAKRLADFGVLAGKAPRVIIYEGASKVRTKRERTATRGYAVGFQGLIEFVESQTPANEVIEQALRRESRMFPSIAIRELVANALIHQDFSVSGASVMIEVYDDRIEVSNPGQPAVTPDRFIDEYRSRNERLADLMRRLGACEEKGSGIDKVIDTAEVFQLPAPEFRVDSVRTTAVLYCHRQFDAMGREDRVRACYQHCCLRYVLRQKATNYSLRSRFGLADDRTETVSRILRDTVSANLIKLEDPASSSKKFARYLPYWA